MKDFKKLYENIIKSEWFKKAYHNKSLGDCPFVIDELEESEDERIRKAALEGIEYLEHELCWDAIGDIDILDVKEYLEKQKESLHISETCKDVIVAIKKYLDWLTGYPDYAPKGKYSIQDMLHCLYVLEKQKEQNSKDEECTDFTIYHPLKNGKGKYECIPYSFYGSLTSFSEDKDLIAFLRTCFYTEEECDKWIEQQKEQKPTEYLSKNKVYDIMNKLTELSTSDLIPIESDEYVKIHEITSDVNSLLDYPIEQKPITTGVSFNPDDYEVVTEGNATSIRRKEQRSISESKRLANKVIEYLTKCGYSPVLKDDSKKEHFHIDIPRHEDDFWHSEEYKHCRSVLGEYYMEGDYGGDTYTLYVWREKKEQKPAEWSEKDEKTIDDAYCWLCEYAGSLMQKNREKSSMLYGIADKLKSLPPQSKEELAKMLQDEYNKGKAAGKREGYTKGYNKGYKDANESMLYHFPVMLTTPSGWGCDGTHCTNPQMDCINCPKKLTGGMFNTASSSGDPTLKADWKPSEEQMEALNALNCHGGLSYVGQQNQLISLYDDLKKLM